MVVVQNPDALSALRSQAGITLAETPQGMQNTIVPVVDITPKHHKVQDAIYEALVSSSSSTNTIGTLDTNKDFYLCNVNISFVKDATCDAADGACTANVKTNTSSFEAVISIPTLTLTAQNQTAAVTLNPPLKLSRGTALQLASGTFTAGKYRRHVCFSGYYVIP